MWGADIINMSVAPEAILANELKIPYAAIAMSTDYDCWHESEAPVTWEMIERTMKQNAEHVKKLLFAALPEITYDSCPCREAVKSSVL
jgi:5'-methylthioadenosine phosphorylase